MISRNATLRGILTGLTVLLALAQGAPARAQKFFVTDLGTLGGATSRAYAVNSAGMVAGMAQTGGSSPEAHAVRWVAGVPQDLGTLGGVLSEARGMNASGAVAGFSEDPSTYPRAFMWDSGGIHDVGTLEGNISQATAINAGGTVVGYASLAGDEGPHAFMKQPGAAMEDLGTFDGGERSFAYAVSDSGWVVGQSYTLAGDVHAFLKPPGHVMADLGTLGGSNSYAYGVRQGRGNVVAGSAMTTGNLYQQACVWSWTRRPTDLGTLGGHTGVAYAINSGEEVVGSSLTAAGESHAFYWAVKGPLYDLNDGIPADSGWVLVEARGISDNGWIVGWGNHNGLIRAFLLTPDLTVGVGQPKPAQLAFRGPSINPMTTNTLLKFELGAPGRVNMDVYDVQGRCMRSFEGDFLAGPGSFRWDGRDGTGRAVGSGVYWARLRAGGQEQARRVAVVR